MFGAGRILQLPNSLGLAAGFPADPPRPPGTAMETHRNGFAILQPDAHLHLHSKDSVSWHIMDLKTMPKLDFSTIPQEDLADFVSLPW